MKHTVLVVDDHEMTRVGLRACAQATGLGEVDWLDASTLSGALAAFAAHRPDLVLLDLKLPDSLGLQGLRRFLAEVPEARVAVFSATEDPVVIEQALALGALGYVPKSARSADILDMVLTLLRGGALPHVCRQPNADYDVTPGSESLNPTQLRVLELVLAGNSNQQIADALGLALGTVKNSVSSVMLKLDAHSRLHLISLFR